MYLLARNEKPKQAATTFEAANNKQAQHPSIHTCQAANFKACQLPCLAMEELQLPPAFMCRGTWHGW
jgi:hypothetical protein